MKCKNCVRHVHLNDDGERTIGTPNWCFYLSDSPDEELERDCKAFKSLTNADRIRGMGDEELAELFMQEYDGADSFTCPVPHPCPPEKEASCRECFLDWLKEEAVSDG